ncbi:MAG: autotransporter outer membrane beta-barrel domain-containing protein [Alphaproteobacteria bacterium]|nr:autotransporter outer membrane beta-barrel domain-containing protein [Alphaproteobacteria bacterium]
MFTRFPWATTPGAVLRVSGNYGGGGRIEFNTVLGSDRSASDALVVGGTTSGLSGVGVNDAGGAGAHGMSKPRQPGETRDRVTSDAPLPERGHSDIRF